MAVLFPPSSDELRITAATENVPCFMLASTTAGMKTGKSPGLDKLAQEAIKEVASCLPTNREVDVALILKSRKSPELASYFRSIGTLDTPS